MRKAGTRAHSSDMPLVACDAGINKGRTTGNRHVSTQRGRAHGEVAWTHMCAECMGPSLRSLRVVRPTNHMTSKTVNTADAKCACARVLHTHV